jgi:Protein of unknown function (DUF3156)
VDLLSHDLVGYSREQGRERAVRFVPDDGGVPLEVTERVERRFLGRTTIARFSTTHAGGGDACRLVISHRGSRHRMGLGVEVVQGDDRAGELALEIEGDQMLARVALPLDFTRFELGCDGRGWRTVIELMGASLVAMAFPPMRSYVRLYPDQRDALAGTVAEIDRILGTPRR